MNSLIYRERPSDVPGVERVMYGITVADDVRIRPAEANWHMVFSRREGQVYPLLVGPWSASGQAAWQKDAELLWIRFSLGMYMPHLPPVRLRDAETHIPQASGRAFCLKGSAWEFPDYENVDTFVTRLTREGLLVHDPVVSAVLRGERRTTPSRTVRHRFLQATGQSQGQIIQLERARRAMALLQAGQAIVDVVAAAGYADQPHLTRALKRFMGYTPAQAVELPR